MEPGKRQRTRKQLLRIRRCAIADLGQVLHGEPEVDKRASILGALDRAVAPVAGACHADLDESRPS